MGNCTPRTVESAKPPDECFCIDAMNRVWYLEGYYAETGEPILPEPLESEYVPRKEIQAIEWPADGNLDKPALSPRFTGKLAPLKLF